MTDIPKAPDPIYRIVPHGHQYWQVEKQRFFVEQKFWSRKWYVESGPWRVVDDVFMSEQLAEEYIDGQIGYLKQKRERDIIAAERKRTIPPRGYP